MIATDHHVEGGKPKKPARQNKRWKEKLCVKEWRENLFHWLKKNRHKRIGNKIMIMQVDKSTPFTSFPSFRPNSTRERKTIAMMLTAMLIRVVMLKQRWKGWLRRQRGRWCRRWWYVILAAPLFLGRLWLVLWRTVQIFNFQRRADSRRNICENLQWSALVSSGGRNDNISYYVVRSYISTTLTFLKLSCFYN